MSKSSDFIAEIQQEAVATRKMLERIPSEVFDWKPHEKSMTMRQLAGLTADMFNWFSMMVGDNELDFAKGYEQPVFSNGKELAELLDKNLAKAVETLSKADDAVYDEIWTMRNGEEIYIQLQKQVVVRQNFGHLAHHRGQLSVYLRLKDIPVPSIYGPTADDDSF